MNSNKNSKSTLNFLKDYMPTKIQLLIIPITIIIIFFIMHYFYPMIPYFIDIVFGTVLSLLLFILLLFYRVITQFRKQTQSRNVKCQSLIDDCMNQFAQLTDDIDKQVETNRILAGIIEDLEDERQSLQSAHPAEEQYVSRYSDYEKGTFCKPKKIYDSTGEENLDAILHSIINKKYYFGKNFGLRVLVQQPLSNYVKPKNEKVEDADQRKIYRWVNNKNQWTRFDFIIEKRAEHRPLLAIELDGPSHNNPDNKKQKNLDQYKNGACHALEIPLIRITYSGEADQITEDFIRDNYEEEIIQKLISSLQKQDEVSKEDILKKYHGDSPQDKLVRKYV